MKRNVLVFILVLTLLVCLFPAAATANTDTSIEDRAAEDFEEDPAAEDMPAEQGISVEQAAEARGLEEKGDEEPVIPEETPEDRAAAAALAEQIESDGPYGTANNGGIVLNKASEPDKGSAAEYITVSEGESFYAYEGMTVFNNGGKVFNNRAIVYNNAGTVFNNGGKVFNNAGIVYANSGIVFNNNGTVYNNEAEVHNAETSGDVGNSRVLGYYELKLADYYEPYIVLEGVTTEPGSEKMIISEDSNCRATAVPGYEIVRATATVGDIIMDNGGSSVILTNVDADTILTLEIQPAEES